MILGLSRPIPNLNKFNRLIFLTPISISETAKYFFYYWLSAFLTNGSSFFLAQRAREEDGNYPQNEANRLEIWSPPIAMRINIRSNSSKFKLVITLSPKSTPSKGVKIDPTAKSYLSLDQSNSSFISVLREQFMLKTIFSTTNIYPSEGPRVINLYLCIKRYPVSSLGMHGPHPGWFLNNFILQRGWPSCQ